MRRIILQTAAGKHIPNSFEISSRSLDDATSAIAEDKSKIQPGDINNVATDSASRTMKPSRESGGNFIDLYD